MYRTVGKGCGICAGLGLFGYAMFSAGVARGGGPAISVNAHVTTLLALSSLGGLAVVAWMLRDLERRIARRSIQQSARFTALMRELATGDEVQNMLLVLLERATVRGMLAEKVNGTAAKKSPLSVVRGQGTN